jgi:sugar phosphate permease
MTRRKRILPWQNRAPRRSGPFLLYLLALPVALSAAIILFEPARSTDHAEQNNESLPLARILPILTATLFVGIVFYTMIVKLGEILGLTAAVSPAQIGVIGAGANIGVAVGSIVFSRMRGASGPTLLLTGLTLATIGYLGTGLSGSLVVTSIAVIVATVGFGIMLPALLTWMLLLLPKDVRGRGTGLWTGVFFFGQFFAPLLAAGLERQLGGLANILLMFSALCAIGVIIAAVKRKGAESLLTN